MSERKTDPQSGPLEGSPGNLLPEDLTFEPPQEDDARRRLATILREVRLRLLKGALKIGGDVPIQRGPLDEAYDCLMPKGLDADWSVLNRRRVYLIRKDLAGHLSDPDERAELKQLQDQADRYMLEAAPRPLEALRDLRDELLRREAETDESSQE